MIINDKAAEARLNSPMNLINRLKDNSSRSSAMSLFGIGRKKEEIVTTPISPRITHPVLPSPTPPAIFNPFEKKPIIQQLIETKTPILSDILEDNDSQVKLGLAHNKALELLNSSVALLATKLDDIKADKLPTVVTAASKVVESIRRERNEAAKNNKDRDVHFHFYTPEQKKIDQYEVIDVQ